MSKYLDRAESRIVRSLQADPENMNKVYAEILGMRHAQGYKGFKRDLAQLNNDLHEKGLLPNLEIVESSKTRMGLTLKPKNGEDQQADDDGQKRAAKGGQRPRRGETFDASPGDREKDTPGPGDERTYDGAHGRSGVHAKENARVVADVARRMGVDPVTAVATMLVESRGNPRAIGDNGTSFGLFQLHKGGAYSNLKDKNDRFDPAKNTEAALKEWIPNLHRYHNPGELAAASQRPAHRRAYARMVNGSMAEARSLLGYH